MRKEMRRFGVFCLTLILLIVLSATPISITHAASCSGSGCTSYDPNSMGCGADALSRGRTDYAGGNRVENKRSPSCDAEWEMTTNLSGGTRYAAGSIRYGSGFPYAQSVRSPAKIDNGLYVYTPMKGPESTLTLSCGKLSNVGVIPIPVTENCVGPF